MVMGQVPLAKILDTGRFDFDRAASRAGLAEGTARRAPAGNRGIWHRLHGLPGAPSVPPARFHAFLHNPLKQGRLLRSKGFFWLASRPREAGSWSQSRRPDALRPGGPLVALRADRTVATGRRGLRAIMRHWEEGVGDCRQELVSSARTWTSRPCAQPSMLACWMMPR